MRRAAFVFLTILLALVLCEAGARLLRPSLTRTQPAYYYRQYLEALVQPDEELGWAGKPNASANITNSAGEEIHYQLNRVGWRDPEYNPLEGVANAIAFGDSFTFGVGVRESKRYTNLLENAFRGLLIRNTGVMGYAPDDYLLLANRWLPPEPWAFAFEQLSNNDVSDVTEHRWLHVHSTLGIPAALEPPFSHSLVSHFSEAWNLVAYFAILARETHTPEALEDGLKRLLFSLKATASLANERHVPFIVIQATDWGEPAYGPKIAGEYRDGVVALAKEMNFSLLVPGPLELLPPPDLHWSEKAHHRVAEMLVPAVNDILFPPKSAGAATRGKKHGK
jgi:hypothetical protein